MTFLGHKIAPTGNSPAIRNIEVIENFPKPVTLRQVRRFVGMASFFRKFIPNFSEKAEPLTKLVKKENKFHWGPEQEEAFNTIKTLLTSELILTYPDYTKPFYIFTDASSVAQAGALMQ